MTGKKLCYQMPGNKNVTKCRKKKLLPKLRKLNCYKMLRKENDTKYPGKKMIQNAWAGK